MTAQTMSFETKFFIKRWNLVTSDSKRERLLKSRFNRLYLDSDLIVFLDEFTSQLAFLQQTKRLKMLLLCRKLLVQNPPKIDKAFYEAFREEHDFEVANYTGIDAVKWIDEELRYTREVKEVDKVFGAGEIRKMNLEDAIPLEDKSKEILNQEDIMKLFVWSEPTLRRRKKDGFPAYKLGGKTYANKAEALAWRDPEKSKKIQLSIAKNNKKGGLNHD